MTASELNEILSSSVFGPFLSEEGLRLYFPDGIIAQDAEANSRGCRVKASAGVALSDGHYMTHSLFTSLNEGPDSLVAYAPTTGAMPLREAWNEHIEKNNPHFGHCLHSLPVVTSGLTHALSIMASLFVQKGQKIVTLSPSWDNYDLMFSTRIGASLVQLPLFDNEYVLNIEQWIVKLRSLGQEHILCLFNFPNNPTGFTPSHAQMIDIAQALTQLAREGKKLLVVTDDAYYGLFHDDTCAPASLSDYLIDAHENIGVIKCDAATKESLVWGFRVGFITFAGKAVTSAHLEALIEKVKAAIRTSVSSCSMASQTLLLQAMKTTSYQVKLDEVKEVMKRRHLLIRQAVAAEGECGGITPIPSNSGYFSSFAVTGNAFALRMGLLEKDIALIALDKHLIRVAYSSLDDSQIARVIHELYEGVRNA
ncbi:MAG: aminotransferase class I/II-fold pyridoxal phosphate-dependent enzyme [Sphaerochaetaceae bacterium]|nr:aminotransferase class I/II-fold pyridoxal phosphate-dependent enzyme [Sphaerochaetaceae bacterium]